jgi:hypothetical protein
LKKRIELIHEQYLFLEIICQYTLLPFTKIILRVEIPDYPMDPVEMKTRHRRILSLHFYAFQSWLTSLQNKGRSSDGTMTIIGMKYWTGLYSRRDSMSCAALGRRGKSKLPTVLLPGKRH